MTTRVVTTTIARTGGVDPTFLLFGVPAPATIVVGPTPPLVLGHVVQRTSHQIVFSSPWDRTMDDTPTK